MLRRETESKAEVPKQEGSRGEDDEGTVVNDRCELSR